MSLMLEYPVITSNLSPGYGVYGTADPYDSTKPNNGAMNPLGGICFVPAPSMGSMTLPSVAGYAAGLWCKYVLYKSTSNPTMKSGPAPVYYKDNTFTTVTGTFAEGISAIGGAGLSIAAAGWLLPNTGSVAGVGVGSAITATILNNGGNGSYVWIGLNGFVSTAYVTSATSGQRLWASGDFIVTGVAADGASTFTNFYFIGNALTVGSNVGHVWASAMIF